jgi:mannosyltransferase OCH1-like enzyme
MQEFLLKEEGSIAIPKIIHQTWKTAEIPAEWKAYPQTWKDHHPGWTYRLWTDEDFLPFVREHFPEFQQTFTAYSYQIQRVDAIRYLILHKFGGVYVDMDIECLRPLDDLLAGREFALAAEPRLHAEWIGMEKLLCNAFMASVPGHPFLVGIIDELKHGNPKITLHSEVLSTTGPAMVTRVANALSLDQRCVLNSQTVYPLASNSQEMELLRKQSEQRDSIKKKALENGAYAIHYWANTWVRNLAGPLTNPDPFNVAGYRFFPGKDSPGHDVGNMGRNVKKLAEECHRNAEAVAFNTDGFIKHTLRPPEDWSEVPNEGGNQGLYVKEKG